MNRVAIVCLLCGLSACSSNSVELSVNLRSDLVPGVDVTVLELTVDGAVQRIFPVDLTTDFSESLRIANVTELAPSGSRTVSLDATNIKGELVLHSEALVDNREDAAVVLRMTRECSGVLCTPGSTCARGDCVSSKCINGDEEECPEPDCTIASDCPAPVQPCLAAQCDTGTCLYLQQPTFCSNNEFCDVGDGCRTVDNFCSIVCDDNNECTNDSCTTMCEYSPVDDGSPCTTGMCQSGSCSSSNACGNGQRDGDESDVDCGGSCGSTCSAGMACSEPDDCMTGLACVGGVCAAPSCDDGVRNGTESDVDCGGSCSPCATGRACEAPVDCESGSCTQMMCVNTQCTDGVRNGTETDVDCGGECVSCFCKNTTGIAAGDCDVLIELYTETYGAGWTDSTGWFSDPEPCQWFGITCEFERVTRIVLNNNNLFGSIENVNFEPLTELDALSLSFNSDITGGLPQRLPMFPDRPSGIDLTRCGFTGSIPESINKQVNLRVLNLAVMLLEGPLPRIETMTRLTELRLSFNQLTGSIPDLSNHVALEVLNLDNNLLQGVIPDGITQIDASRGVLLRDNGCLTASPATTVWLNAQDSDWNNGC